MSLTDTDNLIPLHRRLRAARRAHGLTQSALAAEAGCQQSALSMMERGKVDALAHPTLVKIAELLGVELDPVEEQRTTPVVMAGGGRAICTNSDCPANVPYLAGDELLLWPREQPTPGGNYCAWCGEVVARHCRHCQAAIGKGACCTACGTPYLLPPAVETAVQNDWVAARRGQLAELERLGCR